jgi:hypothetical protein
MTIIALVAMVLLSSAITGYTTGRTAEFADSLNLTFNENAQHAWTPQNVGELRSIGIGGRVVLMPGGYVSVSITDGTTTKLLYQTQYKPELNVQPLTLPEPSINITGALSSVGLAVDDLGDVLNEMPVDLTPTDEIPAVEMPAENAPAEEPPTVETPAIDETNVTIESPPAPIEPAVNETNETVYTEPVNETLVTETPPEEPIIEAQPPAENITEAVQPQPEQSETFSRTCAETCKLKDFANAENNYTLIIEVSNATLQIDEISYEIKQPLKPELLGKSFGENEGINDDTTGEKVGEKIENDPAFETYFTLIDTADNMLMLKFYHNSSSPQPIWVESNSKINYTLSTSRAGQFEEVSLNVTLQSGKIPRFRLHVGAESEIFEFGIPATKAEHLDADRSFIEDIYDKVKTQDGDRTTIPSGDYLRVSFNKNLTNKNDITIYARAVSGNSEISVYRQDGDNEIARFSNVGNESLYKVLLTNLSEGESLDTFDLKSVGDVEYDYVGDPSPTIVTFTSSDTWTVPAGVTNVEVLVVAGGGSGGAGYGGGGGGGGGGFVYNSDYSVTYNQQIIVTVGAGGTGAYNSMGDDGDNSVFGTITAYGGGGGGYHPVSDTGRNGGSGGGGSFGGNGGSGSQGNSGGGSTGSPNYGGGGGGGANAGGQTGTTTDGGDGGAGKYSSISGSSVPYAGGGGGGNIYGWGGVGGGGNGAYSGDHSGDTGKPGTANTGGGGGGGDDNYAAGGNGGSGIVILSYIITDTNPTVTLVSPADDTSTYNTTITFTCNATDDNALENITLYVWNSTAEYYTNATTVGGTSNSTSWTVANLPPENYTWNCLAYDNASQSDWVDANYTLAITAPPSVTLISPADNTITTNTSLKFIANVSSGVGLANVSLWTNISGSWEINETKNLISTNTTIETFTSGTTTWTVPTGVTSVEVLVVAGGGGGSAGGGGAGGLLYEASHAVTPSANLTLTVGGGGAKGTPTSSNGADGANSVFDTITASGGAKGAKQNTDGFSGGSGSGSGSDGTNPRYGGSGIVGQGKDGGDDGTIASPYPSGGGGGAGVAGGDGSVTKAGNGGNGLEYSQFASVGGNPAGWFAGGGGGGMAAPGSGGTGGSGGGGNGVGNTGTANSGVANTGGGGGGGGSAATAGDGGSGIVIIKYEAPVYNITSDTVNFTIDNISVGTYGWNVQAFDSAGQSSQGDANWAFTISPSETVPTKVNLSSPENNSTTTERQPTFVWYNATDAEGDNLTYELQLDTDDTFAAPLTINETGIEEGPGSTTNYTITSPLDVDKTYYWRARAYDGQLYGDWSGTWNFTVLSSIVVSLPISIVEFGTVDVSGTYDTTGDSPTPFVVQNDGNVAVNVTIYGTDFWQRFANPSSNYQFKCRENTSSCPEGSAADWTDMTNSSAPSTLVANLPYTNSSNQIKSDIRITVPSDEPAGSRSSTVYIIASAA